MPAAKPATKPAPATRVVRRGRPPKQPTFQEPLMQRPDNGDGRPRDHDGIPIEREELVGNLPSGAAFKISKLHLANQEIAWACRDCQFTADVRRDVAQHRNEEHGARFGKKTPKVVFPRDEDLGDLVLPPRLDGMPAPSNPMEMTLAEVLSLMPSVAAISDLVDKAERERDAAVEELIERRKSDRINQPKIDVHDSLTAEIVDLRLMVKNFGSYDQMKQELTELRAWKKSMIKKLNTLGFTMTEEEQ